MIETFDLHVFDQDTRVVTMPELHPGMAQAVLAEDLNVSDGT